MSFIFHIKFQNQIVKLTFHIHPPLLLFDAKVERLTFFLRLVQCNGLIHKLNMQIECFICIRCLQTCVIIRRSCTIKAKFSNHWAMEELFYTLQKKIDKYISKRRTLELIRLIFNLIKYYLLLFPQYLQYWPRHFSHFFSRKLIDRLTLKWKLIHLTLLLIWKSKIHVSAFRTQFLTFYFFVKSFNMNS